MKKLIILALLIINIVGCALLDAELWEEVKKENKERGRACYRDYKGYFYCEDRYSD